MRRPAPEHVAVVGLGYVGLPVAVAFGKVLPTTGFDIDRKRVRELRAGHDSTEEMPDEALRASHLQFTDDPSALAQADFIIVAVPTPVDRAKRPDTSALVSASRSVGAALKARAAAGSAAGRRAPPTVVYESTVYPGCTEEVCGPEVEAAAGLKAGVDFFLGYSPERINPGDRERTFEKVVKVVSGQDEDTAELVECVYGMVVTAGTHRAANIRTAEAAKVIENVQRDLNIALMNELSMLFDRLGLRTRDVLAASRTKWNFLPFEPGLVGGHCIPVDPYYLTHKAQEVGFHPDVILAGRRINDNMGDHVAHATVRLLNRAGKAASAARLLVLGATFKENVKDVRNSVVVGLVRELESFGAAVVVYDPLVDAATLRKMHLVPAEDPFATAATSKDGGYDAVIVAVAHKAFRERSPEAFACLLDKTRGPGVIVDVKGILSPAWVSEHSQELAYWSL